MRSKVKCSQCPKFKQSSGVCLHLAKSMIPQNVACDYGRRMIMNDRSRKWMAKKRAADKAAAAGSASV